MTSAFTPSTVIDMSKERDWPASLGMLDWDNTNIVFTKRSLIEFLKYTGTTVDTNFSNISKLPRYAKFGKLTDSLGIEAEVEVTGPGSTETGAFVPSRRVRTAPGGPHTDIFAEGDEGDALASAPMRGDAAQDIPVSKAQPVAAQQFETQDESGIAFPSSIKPTRRVRENPGGNSSLANFWDSEEATDFKPTRRVRQGPGGHDSINDIF
ncbi:hypothetical protein HYPSUDRAFT_180224 [Hypholoma sublateritium FD-334 SS-4]|uniref:Uncharacterized protein n=1 Tax=Hypholoma sublateritium (strain FD-334 SS-4) TaxID=945553 RepID=A0A0D2PFE8_HYPSF|nr:hypothetical protein HYPSUDRAFT_180224 [Hypholoma sublateritium FD-334 SS-4]